MGPIRLPDLGRRRKSQLVPSRSISADNYPVPDKAPWRGSPAPFPPIIRSESDDPREGAARGGGGAGGNEAGGRGWETPTEVREARVRLPRVGATEASPPPTVRRQSVSELSLVSYAPVLAPTKRGLFVGRNSISGRRLSDVSTAANLRDLEFRALDGDDGVIKGIAANKEDVLLRPNNAVLSRPLRIHEDQEEAAFRYASALDPVQDAAELNDIIRKSIFSE